MRVTEAAEQGNIPALCALLEAGANPDEWNENGLTALYLAMDRTLEGESSEAVRVLLAHGADVNRANDGGSTPLSHAAFLCNLELVQLLLDSGADIDLQDETGETALFGIGSLVDSSPAARKDTLRLLLAHGANPNILNEEGACVLSYAAVRGDMDAVNLLLEARADPNLCDDSGDTPLMWAAHGQDPTVIHRLVEAGAQVNAQSTDIGYTPLIWAASSGTVEHIKLLLQFGADPQLRDKWGQIALDKCIQKPEATALLLSAMPPEQARQLPGE